MGRRRPILGEKGEEVIDGTSVMVQPSISRTYTFIIYYPRRYGYFASGTSSLSPSLPITPRCCFLLVATPDASAKPKGRPVTKQPFHPSVHGFVRADLRSSRSILEYFVKISARKFESEFSFFFIAEDKEERADRFFSLYAFAPAASRNKCAFGPIIVAVAARKDRDQDDDHDRT